MSRPNNPNTDAAAVDCAENVSLLFLLNKLQHKSEPNRPVPEPVEEMERILSFGRERSLCGALAFLASIDGNPDFIPAVYIEELAEPQRLEVVVAVNKESPKDVEVPRWQVLKSAFFIRKQELIRLRVAFEKQGPEIEDSVLREVVAMCYKRILKRLRVGIPEECGIEEETEEGKSMAHLRPTRQRHSIERLLTTFDSYFKNRLHLSSLRPFRDSLKEILKRAHTVTLSLRKWERYQKPPALQTLVEEVFQLSRVNHFEELVHMIPHTAMDPGLKSSLCNMISKVARYKEVSRHIYRTAKKYDIARRAEVVTVNLACPIPGAYERISEGSRCPELTTALARNGITALPNHKLKSIWKNAPSPLKDVNLVFENKTSSILKSAKVHAEVQLIYHYHLKDRPSELPPRVIRSSKDACYLCNAFIEAEKTFYTSRCHGRLYPSWKLPLVGSRLDLAQRFNELLKGRIRSAYGDMANFKANCPKAIPPESTLSTLNWSISTVLDDPLVPTIPSPTPQDQENAQSSEGLRNATEHEVPIREHSHKDQSEPDTVPAERVETEGFLDKEVSRDGQDDHHEIHDQAAEDSEASTAVKQDEEARTKEDSPGRRNASPVEVGHAPRTKPATGAYESVRVRSQDPVIRWRSEVHAKQRLLRIRTTYAVVRKTYYSKERTPSAKTMFYIEKKTVYSNDGKIEIKTRTFPLAGEGSTVSQERSHPARIRIMMNILAKT
ncbi:hypothetical protein CSAL01_02908 [Colletotrichum salicis]|uniref:Uncharacterized protein n=1 Tax=Colletotrichum salicis TaxID=1209931 RepID=A0A135UZN3_9PEZI|nr:hypothetical protein CSAL01_02908 [Colletotrichum salicis]